MYCLQHSGTYSWNSLHTDGNCSVAAGKESLTCSRAPAWMKRTVFFIILSFYDLGDV